MRSWAEADPGRPTRIAFVPPLVAPISEPQQGGAQAVVADLAVGLTSRGHSIDIFAPAGSFVEGASVIDTGISASDLQPALFRPSVSRPVLPVVIDAFAHVYSLIDGDYDLVHNHAFDVPAISLSRKLPVPVIHTLHLPPDLAIGEAAQEAVGRGQTIAAVSRSLASSWSSMVPVHPLRNGVPVRRIPWSTEGGTGALFAGRLSQEKGALEALAIAERAGIPLTLVGNRYDSDYARKVEARAQEVPGARVEVPLPRESLWKRMCQSSVVLCPSRWEEPFGMVAAESLAAGTPVVAFARGGLIEILEDGRAGALVADGDIVAAADAVRETRSIDRSACRVYAEKHLDLEKTLDAHEELYARVLNSR